MAEARTLIRGAATVSGARFLGLIFTLIQVKLTVTHLGTDQYGLLVIVTLFISFFAGWSEFGVGSVVVRRVAGGGHDLERQVGLNLALSLVIMGPMLVALFATAWALYHNKPIEIMIGIAILSIGLLGTVWASCFTAVAQVTNKFGYYASADLIGRVLSLGTILIVIAAGGGLRWFFLAQLFVPLGQLAAMTTLGRRVGRFVPVWSRREIVDLVREALPITYLLVIGVTYFTIDGILLSKLAEPAQVGAYGFSYRTVGAATIIATSLASVLAARLSAVAAESSEKFSRSVATALRFTAVVAAPFAVFVTPVAADLIRFAGSEELVPLARTPISVLAIAIAIGMISAVLSTAIIACHRQGVLTRLNTVTLGINIVLNLLLIPHFQATGAAIALVATEALGFTVAMWVLSRSHHGVFPLRAFALLPIPLAGSLAVGELLGVHWLLRLAAMSAVYGTLILMLRITSVDEIRGLVQWRKRDRSAPGV